MDTFLADYFGTNQDAPEPAAGDDFEKMAQLVMLDKLAQDENVDLSELSGDECVALANEVFNEQGEQGEQAGMTELEKEAQAKFEEAKFLGQVVAHSMWNELDSIQKVAKGVGPTEAAKFEEATQAVRRAAADAKAYGGPAQAGGGGGGGRVVKSLKDVVGEKATAGAKATKGGVSAALRGLKAHKGKAALIGGGLALAGGAYGAGRAAAKSKEGSALDALTDARAYEILQSHGLVDDQGNVVAPEQLQEKTAADELAEAVELEAWQKLASLGYPVINQDQ